MLDYSNPYLKIWLGVCNDFLGHLDPTNESKNKQTCTHTHTHTYI